MWPQIVICLVLGYAFGCFQTGYILSRIKGVDIRKQGSGNVGTTNVIRTFGKKTGYMVFAGDFLKAIIPMLLVRFLIYAGDPEIYTLIILTGLGVVLGHNYPCVLKFKGGKGIACTSGVMAAFDWRFLIIIAVIFAIIFFTTRYVSIGSLVIVSSFPILILIFYFGEWKAFAISLIIAGLAFLRHKDNIKRLINGTENRFTKKK